MKKVKPNYYPTDKILLSAFIGILYLPFGVIFALTKRYM